MQQSKTKLHPTTKQLTRLITYHNHKLNDSFISKSLVGPLTNRTNFLDWELIKPQFKGGKKEEKPSQVSAPPNAKK
jgi:hypothetical protein